MSNQTLAQPPKAPRPIEELGARLGYTFKSLKTLELACVHKSFGNEHRANERLDTRNNERFEFLGDAILDFIVSQVLVESFPSCSEGDLSKLRAGLVNERSLAKIARQLELGEFVWLGKGEEHTGGRTKDSILASTFEAVVAAVFVDGGFDAASSWVRKLFETRVKQSREQDGLQDYKTRLQEVVQSKFKVAPKYEVIQSTGPDHDKTFEVQIIINGKIIASASGKSKKEAEQSAAKTVFDLFGNDVNL